MFGTTSDWVCGGHLGATWRLAYVFEEACDSWEQRDNVEPMDEASGMVISDVDTLAVRSMDLCRDEISCVEGQEKSTSESSHRAQSPFPYAFHTLRT